MAGKLSTSANGIDAGGSRATAVITTNTRVRTSRGFVGLVSDVVTFADGTGVWLMPNQRVRINNVPTIGASSVGLYTATPPSPKLPAPMMVVDGDPRVEGM